ncbi:integrase core domain-containing protein, partial [Nocardia sp. NPDC051570]|uniref:integrase core domain-containing protein n=1 Tax=Nocardia sp. NPDC051570 TaxID=3364324 RepID=UPI0037B2CADE
ALDTREPRSAASHTPTHTSRIEVLQRPVESVQYTSKEFAEFCTVNGVRRSLGRTGSCFDNAVAESFFATYKKELVHTRPWPTVTSLEKETFGWIEFYYNTVRPHSTLGYLTPRQYELGYREISQIAA